jgi:hypothetical protein
MSQITIEPVTSETLSEFAAFLHNHLRNDRSSEQWASELQANWNEERPNYGFMLKDAGEIVGGIGAFYKTRIIRDHVEKFCNITSWCVLDKYRQHSMRLALSVINQPEYHFTDFTPTQVVSATLKFFNFVPLDERVAVILNLFWHPLDRHKVLWRAEDIEQRLTGQALQIYKDHVIFSWLSHILVGEGNQYCHIIYKRTQFKGLPAVSILYLSHSEIFDKYSKYVASYLVRQGYLSTHVEVRLLKKIPWLSKIRSGFNAKLFLSKTLSAQDIDYLYSELMALDL